MCHSVTTRRKKYEERNQKWNRTTWMDEPRKDFNFFLSKWRKWDLENWLEVFFPQCNPFSEDFRKKKSTVWINHIMCRSHDDRLLMTVWGSWFFSTLGVPIPTLIANPRTWVCHHFDISWWGSPPDMSVPICSDSYVWVTHWLRSAGVPQSDVILIPPWWPIVDQFIELEFIMNRESEI